MARPGDPEDRALQDQVDDSLERSEGEIARAREAELLLENPLLNNSLDLIERTWEEAWRSTAPNDTDKREQAYRMLYALTEFRSELRTVIETGKMAVKTMDTIQSEQVGSSRDTDTDT